MRRSSGILVLLAFLLAGNANAQSAEEQAVELEKAVADLEQTQELVRVRQAQIQQALKQVREKEKALQTVVQRLDAALARVGKPAVATPTAQAGKPTVATPAAQRGAPRSGAITRTSGRSRFLSR